MTTQHIDSIEEYGGPGRLFHGLVAAATLAVLVLAVAVLLWPVESEAQSPLGAEERAGDDENRATGRTRDERTGTYGNPASVPVMAANPERIIVYLVASVADAELLAETYRAFVRARRAEDGIAGLPADELVLAMGTPEEQERAAHILRDLDLHGRAGAVRVIDLRQPW